MKRPLIAFGDALKACHHLHPDEAAGRAILKLLGLGTSARATPAQASVGAWKPTSTGQVSSAQRRRSASGPRYVRPEVDTRRMPAAKSSDGGMATSVTHVGRGDATFHPPAWIRDEAPMEALNTTGESPEKIPLFARVHRRGILSAALATFVEEGEIDVEAIVATLAAGRPLRSLPRLHRETTRLGVQLLLDRGSGMSPFREDQEQALRALDDILADDRLEVLEFEGCPSRGLLGPASGLPARWKRPPPGTPILAITDLGIGGPLLDSRRATVTEWGEFAADVRRTGHQLIGLVPYEAMRWPPCLARSMSLIHWCERTTAGEVRRATRDAKRRLR